MDTCNGAMGYQQKKKKASDAVVSSLERYIGNLDLDSDDFRMFDEVPTGLSNQAVSARQSAGCYFNGTTEGNAPNGLWPSIQPPSPNAAGEHTMCCERESFIDSAPSNEDSGGMCESVVPSIRCCSSFQLGSTEQQNSNGMFCDTLLPRPATAGFLADNTRRTKTSRIRDGGELFNRPLFTSPLGSCAYGMPSDTSPYLWTPRSAMSPPPGLATSSFSSKPVWEVSDPPSRQDTYPLVRSPPLHDVQNSLHHQQQFSKMVPEHRPMASLKYPNINPISQFCNANPSQFCGFAQRKLDSACVCQQPDYFLLQALQALTHGIGGQQLVNGNSGLGRPLRSQKVDVRILYAMMYRSFLNSLAGGRREVCVFCRNNGEHELIYTSHSLKDNRNKVTCPILRAYQCPICLSTGDKAHTIKYCPYNTDSGLGQDTPLEKLIRYVNGAANGSSLYTQQVLPASGAIIPPSLAFMPHQNTQQSALQFQNGLAHNHPDTYLQHIS